MSINIGKLDLKKVQTINSLTLSLEYYTVYLQPGHHKHPPVISLALSMPGSHRRTEVSSLCPGLNLLENPKSVSFTIPSFSKNTTFSGLRSLCTTCNLWQYWIAVTICLEIAHVQ